MPESHQINFGLTSSMFHSLTSQSIVNPDTSSSRHTVSYWSVSMLFAYWIISACFIVVCWFFSKSTFSKNYFRNIISVSNSLDPDRARHFVGSDLDPNCLLGLSADDTSRQRASVWGSAVSQNSIPESFLSLQCQSQDSRRHFLLFFKKKFFKQHF